MCIKIILLLIRGVLDNIHKLFEQAQFTLNFLTMYLVVKLLLVLPYALWLHPDTSRLAR